ncbi:MAG: hypothetical protein ACRYG7_41025 [Janthinobacterium lividum]
MLHFKCAPSRALSQGAAPTTGGDIVALRCTNDGHWLRRTAKVRQLPQR